MQKQECDKRIDVEKEACPVSRIHSDHQNSPWAKLTMSIMPKMMGEAEGNQSKKEGPSGFPGGVHRERS